MLKASCLLLGLSAFSATLCAEPTDSCAGLGGPELTQCRANQQTLQRQHELEQQLRQQEERQNQLDKQQRDVQQQLETMRLQNESLRRQLEQEIAKQPARPVANSSTAAVRDSDLKNWRADNPWFGTDYAKTQFAMRYLKQLQQERPDLAGRELLDALSTKVKETFPVRP